MTLQFDHAFSFVPSGSKSEIASRLVIAGFIPGPSKRHTGQGTENLVLLFQKNYFEFIWECAPDEISSHDIKRACLKERSQWPSSRYSPFGLAVQGSSADEMPFPKWDYRPPYLTDDKKITVADLPLTQLPMLFHISPSKQPSEMGELAQPFLKHPNGSAAITEIEISVPKNITATLSEADKSKLTSFYKEIGGTLQFDSEEHLMCITIDGGHTGQLDFRPLIPVEICW